MTLTAKRWGLFAAAGAAPASAEHIRSLARNILSQRQFTPPPRSLSSVILGWLGQRLSDLVTSIVAGHPSSLVALALIALVVILIVVAATKFARRVKRDPGISLLGSRQSNLTPTDWLTRAEEHALSERWRDAVRCHYRYLVASLAEQKLLDEVPGRTASEHADMLALSAPSALADFTLASTVFERTWYGHSAASNEEYLQLMEAAKETLRLAARSDRREQGASPTLAETGR